ncbi:hypothetical protein ACL02T_32235 [Pseudonocardia sp. RS010]|uniref:hypothetical protein n=1 Tax=Pseudonocardia sp. RS010 TaxID=3385979 RepID=UPI0039A3079F
MTHRDAEVPAGLGARGAALWRGLHDRYAFDVAEELLLVELCRTADTADELAAVLRRDGVTTAGSKGQTRVHPAVAELRNTQLAAARLVRELDLPDEEAEATVIDPQKRMRSEAARKAAQARWGTRGATA